MPVIQHTMSAPIRASQRTAFSAQTNTTVKNTNPTSPDRPAVQFGSGNGWVGLTSGLGALGAAIRDKMASPAQQQRKKQDEAFRRNFNQCDTVDEQQEVLRRYLNSDDPESRLCGIRCMEMHFVLNSREKEMGEPPLHPLVRRCLNEAMERLQYDADHTVASAAKKLLKKRNEAQEE